jgi:hypothetical protein
VRYTQHTYKKKRYTQVQVARISWNYIHILDGFRNGTNELLAGFVNIEGWRRKMNDKKLRRLHYTLFMLSDSGNIIWSYRLHSFLQVIIENNSCIVLDQCIINLLNLTSSVSYIGNNIKRVTKLRSYLFQAVQQIYVMLSYTWSKCNILPILCFNSSLFFA